MAIALAVGVAVTAVLTVPGRQEITSGNDAEVSVRAEAARSERSIAPSGNRDAETSGPVAELGSAVEPQAPVPPVESEALIARRGDLHILEGAVVSRIYWPDGAGPEGAMGVWGEPATAEVLQGLLPNAAGSRFETEPIDADWAAAMEARIRSLVSASTDEVTNVSAVECRSTVCRAIVDYGRGLRQLDEASRRQHFRRASALLVDSFEPLISEPAGRFNHWVSAVQSSVDGELAIYTLVGPSF